MVVFDPNDENIPQKLWDHFESWATMVLTSRLQYLQYGRLRWGKMWVMLVT